MKIIEYHIFCIQDLDKLEKEKTEIIKFLSKSFSLSKGRITELLDQKVILYLIVTKI